MAEKESPTDEPTELAPALKKESRAKEKETVTSTESIPEIEEEKPPVKEKAKRKEMKAKKRTKLTVLQAAVLETIRERPQRPRAIQTIIQSVGGISVPRNEIIRSLNELKDKGLIEKVSAKAWQAT